MKNIFQKNKLFYLFFLLTIICLPADRLSAAAAATIKIDSIGNTSSQITIFGDPNSKAELHYGKNASTIVVLGSTDQNGFLTLPINTSSYDISCGKTAFVIVNGQKSETIPWSSPSDNSCSNSTNVSGISFDQNNILMRIGERKNIKIEGAGSYYISENNSPVIIADITGNSIDLYASAFGGSNITVCQRTDNKCAVLYVVSINSTPEYTNNNSNTSPFSFNVSSNSSNESFLTKGNIINVTFNYKNNIDDISVNISNNRIGVTGNGSGPYKFAYTVKDADTNLLPVSIKYRDLKTGNTSQLTFFIGNLPVSINSNPAVQAPTTTTSNTNNYVFTKFLNIGTTGTEVGELQKRLTNLGYYTGPITGKFGPLTEAGVKKLQKANNITQAGYVGPSTRAILNKY